MKKMRLLILCTLSSWGFADSNTHYNIMQNGYCLDIPTTEYTYSINTVLWNCIPDAKNQQFIQRSSGALEQQTLCLDIKYGDISPGQEVTLYPCHDGEGQQFKVELTEKDGPIKAANDLCLDSHGVYKNPDTKLTVEKCNNTNPQKFTFHQVVDTYSNRDLASYTPH